MEPIKELSSIANEKNITISFPAAEGYKEFYNVELLSKDDDEIVDKITVNEG